MANPKLADIKPGDVLIADGGFEPHDDSDTPCLAEGERLLVEADLQGEIYVRCRAGRHYLDGQHDEETGELIGLRRV